MELQEKSVVDKMMKNNIFTFCVFAVLLALTIVQPALAVSTDNKIKTVSSISPTNQTLHKSAPVTVHKKAVPVKDACPCIVFRLDDVQEFYLANVQMQIMDLFQKKNASLSIGIIGHDLSLDTKLTSYLKNNLKPGHAPLELENHSWLHEDFSVLSLSKQVSSMNKTNQELKTLFGKTPSVFITPYNVYGNDTLKAMKQLKMNLISSGIWEEDKFVTDRGHLVTNKDFLGLYHVPSMTDFQVDIGNESHWTSIPKDKVIASVNSHITKYGYDVLLIHPENFAVIVNGTYTNTVDKNYLNELASIIDYAKSKHIRITTLSGVAGLDHVNNILIKKISKTTTVSKPVSANVSKLTSATVAKSVIGTPASKPSQKVNYDLFDVMSPPKPVTHVQPNGSLTMNVKYVSGDRVGAYAISLKIYQDFGHVPYRDIPTISENPYTVISLPLYHQYKIETYVGGMLSSTNLVSLDTGEQDLDVNIPDGGSIQVSVYYNDGQTPIPNASVSIQSQDNKTRDTGITDPDGLASKFYLPSTIVYGNYYVANAKLNNHLTFSSTPVALQPGDASDIKLIAPWPPVVQNLVTIKVYNQTKILSSYGKTYAIDMYDDQGNKLVESPINIHGEGYFWSMKTGDYVFKVVNTTSGEVLGNLVVTLDGTKNNFDVMIQKHSLTQISN
jgi:peptidoglycan/xylan/chitin deacetylase (PgdA/CDA1 family)